MMNIHKSLSTLALLATSLLSLQAQNLGVASISGEAYKVTHSSVFSQGIRGELGIAVNGRAVPYFQENLQIGLDLLVPAWLKDAGAADLVVWDRKAADEAELSVNHSMGRDISIMGAIEDKDLRRIEIGGKKKEKEKINDLSVRWRDQTNAYADQLNRDYLLFVRVVATHNVTKNKLDKPLKVGKKFNGVATIVVTIIDAADASVIASNMKHINESTDGGLGINSSLSSKALINKCEGIVKRTYKKFLKKIAE
ncbi:hypothetical protein CEQ90_01070 [Lewinellaceae bacterium SD302]|nr:hypothetical protein CEQ90_01070 [Lewinellaceae bacterium SD302]